MLDDGVLLLRDRGVPLMAQSLRTRKRHQLCCDYCRGWVDKLVADARPNSRMCLTCWQRFRGDAAPLVVRTGNNRLRSSLDLSQ
jgi:hypothetical protein